MTVRPTRASLRPPFAPRACAAAALIALCSVGLTQAAQAQVTPPDPAASAPAPTTAQKLQRVEITGSAIKRIADEGALPVQVINRNDIVKAGVTTAAEIMATVSAMSNALTDGVSIGTGGVKDQMGFNSANLRGLGTSSTLVLLNGRRMANFASPGDDNGVDLNNIPAAAIERVEVLLDGASAIYGTDAIGGVVNFITRKDYQGVQLDVYGGKTGEGGAGKRTASIAAGHGDLARDGFNVMGVLDFQKTDALRTSQRDFIAELRIPERLPHLLSGVTFPGNIRLSSDQRDYLQEQDFLLNGRPITNRTINLSIPDCRRRTRSTCRPASAGSTPARTTTCATSSCIPRPRRATSSAAAWWRWAATTSSSSRRPTRAARAGTWARATGSTRCSTCP